MPLKCGRKTLARLFLYPFLARKRYRITYFQVLIGGFIGWLQEHFHVVDGEDEGVTDLTDLPGVKEFDTAGAFVEIKTQGDTVTELEDLAGLRPNLEVDGVGGFQHLAGGGEVY